MTYHLCGARLVGVTRDKVQDMKTLKMEFEGDNDVGEHVTVIIWMAGHKIDELKSDLCGKALK